MMPSSQPKNSFTFVLNAQQQQALKDLLALGNYRTVTVPHTQIAVEAQDCRVNLYTSGKCLVQGKGAHEFVLFFLEPNVLGAATLGYEEVINPESITPHMGIDESGKGDFFGTLVACAAYVDPDLAHRMQEIGVKDCKLLSDKQVFAIGTQLRNLLGRERYALIIIGPSAYNRLYAKIRNVNNMLAWAHARAIENLLETMPDCPRAVADQFGAKQVIERALMKNGKKIVLEQRHKAESDIAVAAASILARESFLRHLTKLAEAEQVPPPFPKGASEQVRNAAISLVRAKGPQVLLANCKCHFRTADAVLAAAGASRAALGPDGAAVSRTMER